MHPEVTNQIQELREDRTHGASWLARQALGAAMLTARTSEARTVARLLEELKAVTRELIEAKPSMASITNAVCRFVYEVAQESEQQVDLDSLKRFTQSRGEELVKASEEAVAMIAQRASELISTDDKLFSCSYSSTVCHALKVAKGASKDFSVLIAESKFGPGESFGGRAAEEIGAYGISVEIIPDEAIRRNMARVDKVLVGADSVLSDGSLINGTPSYELALAAKDNAVPFYVLCEKSKFNVRSHVGQEPEPEEGFDRVPAQLITGILTEEGMLGPEEVIHSIKEMERYIEILLPMGPELDNP